MNFIWQEHPCTNILVKIQTKAYKKYVQTHARNNETNTVDHIRRKSEAHVDSKVFRLSDFDDEVRNSTEVQYSIGGEVFMADTYHSNLDEIYLEKDEKVTVDEITNNHILVSKNGDKLGYVPKRFISASSR